jgi:hypothetical protein
MTVYAEPRAHSGLNFLDGASDPEVLIAGAARVPAPTVATSRTFTLSTDSSGFDIGGRSNGSTAMLAITLNANFDEVIPASSTSHGGMIVRIATVFSSSSVAIPYHLACKYEIHGTTSDNGISAAICPSSSHYKIHGTTSDDGVLIFATISRVFALNAAGTSPNIGWRRSTTTTTLATTISIDFDEATPPSLASRGWASFLTVTVFTVIPDSIDCDGARACQWRTAGICDR